MLLLDYRLTQTQVLIMALQYYDHTLGRERFKRRYIWAVYAFGGGVLVGMIFAHLI